MNSKRIKFALFMCVFALYGCASSASVTQKSLNTVNNKHTVSVDTLHTNSLIQTKRMIPCRSAIPCFKA